MLLAGAATGGALLSSGCESSTSSKPAGPPRRGGTLRVGAIGRASAIVRDPHGVQANDSDYLILSLLYDTLTIPAKSPLTAPRLATRWSHDGSLRRWRFELDRHARFHDGSPVTSEDVVWSLRRLRESESGASRLPGIEAKDITADGPHTVVVDSGYPDSQVPLLMRLTTFVMKKGTKKPEDAPGTGPFKLDWFHDGNARLVRNEHWYGGKVWLDAVEVTMFESPASMVNAALSGQLDLASNVGTVAARSGQGRSGFKIVRRPDDMALPLVMRTSDGPFADSRVREALRLAVDRKEMVSHALGGYGTVANDVLGTGDPEYDHHIPQRTRNLAKARSLLKQADFDLSKSHKLLTSEDVPGLAESATLLARQIKEAGVELDVVKQDSGTFLGESRGKAPLYTSYWGTNDSVIFCAGKLLVSDSTMNEANWQDEKFDDAYRKAVGTAGSGRHEDHVREVQRMQHDSSGYLLWGMADGVDLAKDKVNGLPRLPGYGRVQLENTWLSSS
nr:ABC transporter substrate-binding protein [Streptomyces sp. HNM0575]